MAIARPKHGPPREHLMQLHSDFNTEPKWSFGSRAHYDLKRRLEAKEGEGRPHSYAFDDLHDDSGGKWKRSAKYSFSQIGRNGLRGDNPPGPGCYTPGNDPSKRRPPSCGFGSSGPRRGLEFEGSASPGPAKYDCRGGLGGPRAVILARGAGRKIDDTPGPGVYSDGSKVAGVPHFGFPPRAQSVGANARGGGGDIAGHISVFGNDGKKYSFNTAPLDANSQKLMSRSLGCHWTQFGHHGW